MFPHAAISDETFKGFCPDWAFPIKSDVQCVHFSDRALSSTG